MSLIAFCLLTAKCNLAFVVIIWQAWSQHFGFVSLFVVAEFMLNVAGPTMIYFWRTVSEMSDD